MSWSCSSRKARQTSAKSPSQNSLDGRPRSRRVGRRGGAGPRVRTPSRRASRGPSAGEMEERGRSKPPDALVCGSARPSTQVPSRRRGRVDGVNIRAQRGGNRPVVADDEA